MKGSAASQVGQYAERLRDLAVKASAGQDMMEQLAFTLVSAKMALGSGRGPAVVACQQYLLSCMQESIETDSDVIYNAVLNWAIRDLGKD